jgi:hypothetical protein
MLDPEAARKILREYHATTAIEERIEDIRRISPVLAERLGLNEPFVPRGGGSRGLRGFFASFGRSVQRLFSRSRTFDSECITGPANSTPAPL